MPEPTTPKKETYNERGRVNVSTEVFEDPPVETTPPAGTTTPATTPPAEATPPTETTPPTDTTTPETLTIENVTSIEPDKLDDTQKEYLEKHKTELTEEQRTKYGLKVETAAPTPKLYAGKYQTVDELKKAYQNLGGDPTRFKNDRALEEAYEYRNSEYTKVQQENAERERLSQAIEARKKAEKTPEQLVEDMMGKIDWTKVTDAQTLTKQLLPILIAGMPKGQPAMDEKTLVQKLIPIIQDRERKQEALATIETEVPRLKSDQSFRKAFALHVVGGKDGVPYPKTADGLRMAMKDFLVFSRSMADETARQKEIDMRGKNAAITPSGGSPGLAIPSNTSQDEVDQIISAYAEKQKKLSFI